MSAQQGLAKEQGNLIALLAEAKKRTDKKSVHNLYKSKMKRLKRNWRLEEKNFASNEAKKWMTVAEKKSYHFESLEKSMMVKLKGEKELT